MKQVEYAHDILGRRVMETDPLGHAVHRAYDAENHVVGEWGATYPAAYEYDAWGSRTALYTYRGTNDIESAADLLALKPSMDRTRWLLDEATGLVTNKLYADGKGPTYTYTPDGEPLRRVWARGVATDYAYDPIGNREWTTLNGVTNTYAANSLNQYTSLLCASAPLRYFNYDADGNMTADERGWHYVWNGENRMVCASNAEVVVTYAYDHRGRMVKKGIVRSNGDSQSIAYLWDDWNIIREILTTNDYSRATYNVWGLDIDGTLQGAGGVGGLLSVVRGGEAFLPTYDASGRCCVAPLA